MGSVGGYHCIREGISQAREGQELKDTTEKTCKVAKGVLLASLGLLNIAYTLSELKDITLSLPAFYKLDPMNQAGIAKHLAISSLSKPKFCNALILEATGEKEAGGLLGDDPLIELVYEKCNAIYHNNIRSFGDFYSTLKNAAESFSSKAIDVLVIKAHSNPAEMSLSSSYHLPPLNAETFTLKAFLADKAQVLLLGCNTASSSASFTSIAKRFSDALPGKEIVGFAASHNPFLMLSGFKNGRFSIEGLYMGKQVISCDDTGCRLSNAWTYPFNAISYLKPVES